MKVKKVITLLIVSVCISVEVFSQEYKAERTELNEVTSHFTPPPITYRINPKSSNEEINHISINSVEFKKKIISKNNILYDYVSYEIVPKENKEIILFHDEKDSLLETGGTELFITEDTMYQIKIPKFSWNGIPKLREEDKTDEAFNYITKDTNMVIDGIYILKINLLRYNSKENAEREQENVADLQEIHIVIDTTPPKIAYDVVLVCDNPQSDSYTHFIIPKSEFSNKTDYMAHHWKILLDENEIYKINSNSEFPIPLPPVKLGRISKQDDIKVIAIDDLGNSSSDDNDYVPERVILQPIVGERNIEKDASFAYFKAVRNTLLPFCSGSRLDLDESLNQEFNVDPAMTSLISSYSEAYPLYVCFTNAKTGETFNIPIEVSEDSVTFSLRDIDFEKGTYQVSLTDGGDREQRLCRKYIYSSKSLLKIVTKVGFDERNLLDVDDILFPPSKYSFLEIDELRSRNLPIISSAISIINDNISDIEKIEILGYANPEMAEKGAAKLLKENEESLIPLSQKRGEYVKMIMVLMGIPSDLIEVVPCGGELYEFNPKKKDVNFQNRRVRINVVRK